MGHKATPKMPAGIEFRGAWGTVCADDPNKLASLVEDFLAGPSREAENLRIKLGRSRDEERHAFLVLTSAVGQAWLFDDWGPSRLPDTPMRLPAEVDTVWLTRGGPTVWWCDRTGWSGALWSDVGFQAAAH